MPCSDPSRFGHVSFVVDVSRFCERLLLHSTQLYPFPCDIMDNPFQSNALFSALFSLLFMLITTMMFQYHLVYRHPLPQRVCHRIPPKLPLYIFSSLLPLLCYYPYIPHPLSLSLSVSRLVHRNMPSQPSCNVAEWLCSWLLVVYTHSHLSNFDSLPQHHGSFTKVFFVAVKQGPIFRIHRQNNVTCGWSCFSPAGYSTV